MNKTSFDEEIKLGEVDGENIYLSAPSWDCDWYWGFGYLRNRNCHYHVDGLTKTHNTNLFEAIKKEFGDTLHTELAKDEYRKLWVFCELMQTFYTLKDTAEVLGRGGSNYTTNPHSSLIKNTEEVTRINEKVLPAIFDSIWYLFGNKI